jgi:hypothetical protein
VLAWCQGLCYDTDPRALQVTSQKIQHRLGRLALVAVTVTRIGVETLRHLQIIGPDQPEVESAHWQTGAAAGRTGDAGDRERVVHIGNSKRILVPALPKHNP